MARTEAVRWQAVSAAAVLAISAAASVAEDVSVRPSHAKVAGVLSWIGTAKRYTQTVACHSLDTLQKVQTICSLGGRMPPQKRKVLKSAQTMAGL